MGVVLQWLGASLAAGKGIFLCLIPQHAGQTHKNLFDIFSLYPQTKICSIGVTGWHILGKAFRETRVLDIRVAYWFVKTY